MLWESCGRLCSAIHGPVVRPPEWQGEKLTGLPSRAVGHHTPYRAGRDSVEWDGRSEAPGIWGVNGERQFHASQRRSFTEAIAALHAANCAAYSRLSMSEPRPSFCALILTCMTASWTSSHSFCSLRLERTIDRRGTAGCCKRPLCSLFGMFVSFSMSVLRFGLVFSRLQQPAER